MKPSLLNYVSSQVSRFRQFAGLSDTEAVKLKSLLLKLNVLTLYRPLSESFSGMSLQGNGKRFMLINSSQPICRQHFTIAHELYQLFMEENPMPHKCQENGKKIVLDADVIIHFIKGGLFSLLLEIFPDYEYLILDVVYREVTVNQATKTQIDNTLNLFCRDNNDVLGSSNLRDIKEYCERNIITCLTTLDFLYYAYIKKFAVKFG